MAGRVVYRVLEVYNAEYIAKAAEKEPDSLLGLTKRLEAALGKVLRGKELLQDGH